MKKRCELGVSKEMVKTGGCVAGKKGFYPVNLL
jgi:hypothetical protein